VVVKDLGDLPVRIQVAGSGIHLLTVEAGIGMVVGKRDENLVGDSRKNGGKGVDKKRNRQERGS